MSFWERARGLDYIEVFEPCKNCYNEDLMRVVEREIINKEYFLDGRDQHCIVECRKCNHLFLAKYE